MQEKQGPMVIEVCEFPMKQQVLNGLEVAMIWDSFWVPRWGPK